MTEIDWDDIQDDDIATVITTDEDWLDLSDGEKGVVRHVLEAVTHTKEGGHILTRGPDWSLMSIDVRGDVPGALAQWKGRSIHIYVRRGEDGIWTDADMIEQSIANMALREAA